MSIKKDDCLLVLLNGVPDYQTKGCTNGITKDGLVFTTDYCGIKFSHSNWQDPQLINITGQIDQLANIEDRLINLRLYNADTVAAKGPLGYWINYHTTDIKVRVYNNLCARLLSATLSKQIRFQERKIIILPLLRQ